MRGILNAQKINEFQVIFGESRFAPLLAALGDLPQRWQESAGGGLATVVRCAQGPMSIVHS